MNGHSVVIKIADIPIAISWDQKMNPICLGSTLKEFLSQEKPDVSIQILPERPPAKFYHKKNNIFDSETVWSLYRVGSSMVFRLQAPAAGPDPYQMAVFNEDFSKGRVYHCLPLSKDSGDIQLSSLLGFPFFEVLMVCILSRGHGLMVHACGIDDGGEGLLFAGNSTHGKSTMARLWENQGIILNDDRIILRKKEGHFWMFGTPWHGDYKKSSSRGIPVKKIFFLSHAQSNRIIQKKGTAAASMIMTRCFPPLWDRLGMQFTLDFLKQLVDAVSCYELGFVPNKKIVKIIRTIS